MSHYKDNLRGILKQYQLVGDTLSIGAQVDDRDYFSYADTPVFKTLDIDTQFNPDLVWNMNRPILDDEGGTDFHDHYMQYDNVLALNLWEYIFDPMTAHRNLHFFLKTGGTYMGSYVFVYGKHNPAGTDYLRYTDDGIRKLLTQSLFSNIQITPIKSNDLLTTFYESEGLRIRKDIDHNVTGYFVTATK